MLLSALLLPATLGVRMGLEMHRLDQERTQLQRENTTLFQRAMPGSRMTDEPRFQVAQRLDRIRLMQAPDPLFLQLAAVAEALPSGAHLNNLEYTHGRLHLTIQAPTMESLAQLSKNLQTASVRHRMQSPQPGDGGYTATLKMQAQP